MDKFAKIRHVLWKQRSWMSKIGKFESVLLKTIEDIALQNREILQTFVCLCPHRIKFCKFSQSNFTNFKALFPVLSTDFPATLSVTKA